MSILFQGRLLIIKLTLFTLFYIKEKMRRFLEDFCASMIHLNKVAITEGDE